MMTDNNKPRDKLGLALAGGGFRASLFHIGVLRRMAELDMLRYVETLSTVSGGSIVGALYILLLKREIDRKARLDQSDYVRIIEELDERMSKAIKKNLRVRLFMNPLGIMRVMLTEYSLGLRMSRLYERCVFNETVKELGNKRCYNNIKLVVGIVEVVRVTYMKINEVFHPLLSHTFLCLFNHHLRDIYSSDLAPVF